MKLEKLQDEISARLHSYRPMPFFVISTVLCTLVLMTGIILIQGTNSFLKNAFKRNLESIYYGSYCSHAVIEFDKVISSVQNKLMSIMNTTQELLGAFPCALYILGLQDELFYAWWSEIRTVLAGQDTRQPLISFMEVWTNITSLRHLWLSSPRALTLYWHYVCGSIQMFFFLPLIRWYSIGWIYSINDRAYYHFHYFHLSSNL